MFPFIFRHVGRLEPPHDDVATIAQPCDRELFLIDSVSSLIKVPCPTVEETVLLITNSSQILVCISSNPPGTSNPF